jgi:hypothetical protein
MNPHILTTSQFIAKAKSIHGDRYDYSKTECRGRSNEIAIICKKHGTFHQLANSHLQGRGCAYCNLYGGDDTYNYIQKLNKEKGWQLVGGNQEFSIPSGLTPAGKFRFDGCDIQRHIFFEYNDNYHYTTKEYKQRDALKKQRLKEYLSENHLMPATYVVYNAVTNQLTKEII